MDRRKKTTGKIKGMFHTSGTKHGSYSVGLTVLVIAIVIVFNLVIGQIPEAYRNLDMSSTKIYEISDTTKDLLSGLNDKVDMKVLAVKKDTDDRIKTFISKYAALSDKINVEWIDPVLHPSALTEYNASENTIVVSCEATGKTTTISFDKILVMDMSSYYYSGNASYSEFDGEGQLTSAVNYVTSDVQKTIYKVSGHGEAELSSTVTDLMSKNNYTLTELNLLMADSIPNDCDLLLMNAPTNDLSENEVTLLTNYLAAGGKVMCLLGDTSLTDFPNLASVLKVYGIEGADGYIADPTRCYQNQPYYIFPQLNVSGDLANGISSQMVLLTNTHGMTLTDPTRDTITTSAFMETSENGYAVTESEQKQGTYELGVVATETISSGDDSEESSTTEARLTVISAGSLIDQNITDAFSQLENTQIFMNAVSANFDGVQNLSIEAKSLGTEYNTIQHAGLFSLLVIFGIPAVILIAGFSVWFRRRKA